MESATVSAPARPALSAPARVWSWLRSHAFHIYAGFAVAYMLIPIGVIAVFSFADASENRDHLAFAINNGFTLKYWENAFAVPDLNKALLTSFRLAATTTVISTAIGTLMAIALVRYRFFGRRASNLLLVLPMATPEVVMGASLLSLFLIYGIALGFTSLLIAHIMFTISFVVVVVRSRLIGFDRSIEDAAADLGATPVQTFPIYVFGAHLRGIPVQVNVLATMLFALTVTAICLVLWQQKRAERMASVRPEQEV
jgi:spermidine/putrescine transport system permease protein